MLFAARWGVAAGHAHYQVPEVLRSIVGRSGQSTVNILLRLSMLNPLLLMPIPPGLQLISASGFEAHAGRGQRRAPYDNIFTEDVSPACLNWFCICRLFAVTPASGRVPFRLLVLTAFHVRALQSN